MRSSSGMDRSMLGYLLVVPDMQKCKDADMHICPNGARDPKKVQPRSPGSCTAANLGILNLNKHLRPIGSIVWEPICIIGIRPSAMPHVVPNEQALMLLNVLGNTSFGRFDCFAQPSTPCV